MRMVSLPKTELMVSRLCLGTVNFGTTLNQAEAQRMMSAFFEQGGNFIDTAHVYSDWIPGVKSRSEKIIGQALRHMDRKKIVLSTKGAHYDLQTPKISRVTPEQIVGDLNESLECLKTDYIDLYFLHRDNPAVPVGEIMDCLEEQRQKGKFRYAGCSNWTLPRVMEAQAYAKAEGMPGFRVNQLMWSLAEINRDKVPADYVLMDDATMAYTARSAMSIMCFSAQAKGYFTKRWLGERLKPDVSQAYSNPKNDETYKKITALGDAAKITQYCLHYFETQPVTAIPIVSCNSLQQLNECCNAFS